jgi:predicted nuclease of predicted toxin-antitoxin system
LKCPIDSNLPAALADWLRREGVKADHVDEVLPPSALDAAIWERARISGVVIVTKDSDFRDRANRETGVSVIWVRSGNLKLSVFLAWFALRWPAASALANHRERVIEMR